MKLLKASLVAAFMPVAAFAAPVDLTGWQSDGGSWTVSGLSDTVTQGSNSSTPAFFFDDSNPAQGRSLAGTIRVNTTYDDDFIGFALGYNDNEVNDSNADFWLIDWKQGDQSGGLAGLSLSHVTQAYDGSGGVTASNYWDHDATRGVTEAVRATNLGGTGWNDLQTYNFELTFTSTLIEVFVDGVLEISHSGTFTDGGFAFYGFSQQNVTYAGVTQDVVAPVPLPASLPLFAVALGAFGLTRRRKKQA